MATFTTELLYGGVMQRIFQLIVFVSMAIGSSFAHAIQFEEGVHYQALQTPVTDAPSITEFFSFYCGSCYQHQPFNRMIEEKWPGVLTKYHVSGLTPPNLRSNIQRSWAAAQLLNVGDEFSSAMFNKNFVEREQVNTEVALHALFADVGVDSETLEKTLQSFQVRSLANRMSQLEQRYAVAGTPTYVVNGRYVMDNRAFRDSTNFFSDYLALAEFLLAKH